MPCWYYEKKELRHTPSVMQGITQEEETMYRREGARFILQLGNKMGLRYETMATGVVYFHRFYMVHTFKEFPRHVSCHKLLNMIKIISSKLTLILYI